MYHGTLDAVQKFGFDWLILKGRGSHFRPKKRTILNFEQHFSYSNSLYLSIAWGWALGYYWTLIGSHIWPSKWHPSIWPHATLKGQTQGHGYFKGLFLTDGWSFAFGYYWILIGSHIWPSKWRPLIWPYVTLKGQTQGHGYLEAYISLLDAVML